MTDNNVVAVEEVRTGRREEGSRRGRRGEQEDSRRGRREEEGGSPPPRYPGLARGDYSSSDSDTE